MRTIITGLNGTVAPVIAGLLKGYGHSVLGWDSSVVPIDDENAIFRFLEDYNPDWFFHIATGSPLWAEAIARTCVELNIII